MINVDSGVDYRLRTLEQAELYHFPLDHTAEASLQKSFDSLVPDVAHIEHNVSVEVLGRQIPAKAVCDDMAWFEFEALHWCSGCGCVADAQPVSGWCDTGPSVRQCSPHVWLALCAGNFWPMDDHDCLLVTLLSRSENA